MSRPTSLCLILFVLAGNLLLVAPSTNAQLSPHPLYPNALPTPSPTPSESLPPAILERPSPTPTPTTKVTPGSPLVFGGQTIAEALSQFDIAAIAKLVLVVLAAVWVIVILFYVDREFLHKSQKNTVQKQASPS